MIPRSRNLLRSRGLRQQDIVCYILQKLLRAASTQTQPESESHSSQPKSHPQTQQEEGGGGAAVRDNHQKKGNDSGTDHQGQGNAAAEIARRLERMPEWKHRLSQAIMQEVFLCELVEIKCIIKQMKVGDKVEEIKCKVGEVGQMMKWLDELDLKQTKDVEGQSLIEPLGVLHQALLLMSNPAAARTRQQNRAGHDSALAFYQATVQKTARMIKDHMETEQVTKQGTPPICLHHTQYVRILQQVFPMTTKPLQAEAPGASTETGLAEDQIKEIIPETVVEETIDKIGELHKKLQEQLEIKGLVDKIQKHLNHGTALTIFKIDRAYIDGWEETRNALSLLGCVMGTVVVTITKSAKQAKRYCSTPCEPINYSILGIYHDIVLDHTSQQRNEDRNYNPKILYDILNRCGPHEFCMKIFAHALHTNPKRSYEELCKLDRALQNSPKSLGSIANKMFMFSYRDLTKEQRSCLLYLAIFPSDCNIRRSTLIARWVTEGLINKEDWHHSEHWANQCFDVLIDRWLLYPVNISDTGNVKSCMVGGLVHGFITNIARKQHMVKTSLSHHLACHFSIFNDLRLRGSDRIDTFLRNLSESSELSLLKVLDLEGCHCFKKKQYYLKDICSKMLLLKFLSLRGTNVTQIPSEINNLQALEVFDIRQTKVPASATKHVLLLKLKHLLAGNSDSSLSSDDTSRTSEFSGVRVPYKIEKFVNMEVLSNVKASQTGQELKDIGKLWQLRKLGVVIDDKNGHLINLLRAISDLHECLRSLSISLSENTASSRELPADIRSSLKYGPKLLESLSISGTTKKEQLLPLFTNYGDLLSKVTLGSSWLNQSDLDVLSKLPKLICVRLRCNAFDERKLTFKKEGFKSLSYFLVEGSNSNMTEISFADGAVPELKKIVLSFTNIEYIGGVDSLPKLEELELNNNNNNRLLSLFDNANQIAKVTLHGTSLKQCDLQMLAKKPNMRCLVLMDKSYVEKQLNFNTDEFPQLNHLTVNCSDVTNISFKRGSATKLEKIVWIFTNMESLSGINNLPYLRELEFKGNTIPKDVEETINGYEDAYGHRPDYKHIKKENQDQETGNAPKPEQDDVATCPWFWKS